MIGFYLRCFLLIEFSENLKTFFCCFWHICPCMTNKSNLVVSVFFSNMAAHEQISGLYMHSFLRYSFQSKINSAIDLSGAFCNPGQNIWCKVEKSSKVGQDFKSLLSNFACFLTAIVKV